MRVLFLWDRIDFPTYQVSEGTPLSHREFLSPYHRLYSERCEYLLYSTTLQMKRVGKIISQRFPPRRKPRSHDPENPPIFLAIIHTLRHETYHRAIDCRNRFESLTRYEELLLDIRIVLRHHGEERLCTGRRSEPISDRILHHERDRCVGRCPTGLWFRGTQRWGAPGSW